MPSHIIDYELFGDQFSTLEMRAVFDERTMLQRWLAAFEGRGGFRELLTADPRVKGALAESDLAALMRSETYTRLAGEFVDRVVAEARGEIG